MKIVDVWCLQPGIAAMFSAAVFLHCGFQTIFQFRFWLHSGHTQAWRAQMPLCPMLLWARIDQNIFVRFEIRWQMFRSKQKERCNKTMHTMNVWASPPSAAARPRRDSTYRHSCRTMGLRSTTRNLCVRRRACLHIVLNSDYNEMCTTKSIEYASNDVGFLSTQCHDTMFVNRFDVIHAQTFVRIRLTIANWFSSLCRRRSVTAPRRMEILLFILSSSDNGCIAVWIVSSGRITIHGHSHTPTRLSSVSNPLWDQRIEDDAREVSSRRYLISSKCFNEWKTCWFPGLPVVRSAGVRRDERCVRYAPLFVFVWSWF